MTPACQLTGSLPLTRARSGHGGIHVPDPVPCTSAPPGTALIPRGPYPLGVHHGGRPQAFPAAQAEMLVAQLPGHERQSPARAAADRRAVSEQVRHPGALSPVARARRETSDSEGASSNAGQFPEGKLCAGLGRISSIGLVVQLAGPNSRSADSSLVCCS